MPLTETHNYIDIIKSNNAHLYSLNREEKKCMTERLLNKLIMV